MTEEEQEKYEERVKVFHDIVEQADPDAKVRFDPADQDSVTIVLPKDQWSGVGNALKSKWPFDTGFQVKLSEDDPFDQGDATTTDTDLSDRMVKLEEAIKEGSDKDLVKKAGKLVTALASLSGSYVIGVEFVAPSSLVVRSGRITDKGLTIQTVTVNLDSLEPDVSSQTAKIRNDPDAEDLVKEALAAQGGNDDE